MLDDPAKHDMLRITDPGYKILSNLMTALNIYARERGSTEITKGIAKLDLNGRGR